MVVNRPVTFNTMDRAVVVDMSARDSPVGYGFLGRHLTVVNSPVTMLMVHVFLRIDRPVAVTCVGSIPCYFFYFFCIF
jgi:hypothetical protein